MSKTANSLLKKLFGFSVGPVVGAIIGFITLPVTTWLVAPEEFGKAAMFTLAFSMLRMFFYLGIDVAFIREFHAVENKIKLYWDSLTVPMVISVFFSLFLLFYSSFISNLLFESNQPLVMRALAISLPFAVIERFSLQVVRMQERGKLYSFLSILRQFSKFVFIVSLVLIFEGNFKYIVIAQVLSIIIQTLTNIFFIKEYWISYQKFEWKRFKPLLLFGLPFIPTAIIEWVFNGFDKVALRKWANFEEIGIYSAGFKIFSVMGILKNSFNTFWIPTSYKWHEQEEGLSKYQMVNNIITSIMFLFGACLILLRKYIFLLLAKDYRDAAIILPFLLFIPILQTIKSTTASGISLSRKTYVLIPIYIVTTLLNIIGNILLVPQWGALGAAIATGGAFIITFWLYTIVSRKLWRIKLKFNHMIFNNVVFIIYAALSLKNNYIIDIIGFIIILIINLKYILYLSSKIPYRKLTLKRIRSL